MSGQFNYLPKQTGMDPIERLRFLAFLAPVPGARKRNLSIGSLPTVLLYFCQMMILLPFHVLYPTTAPISIK